MIYCLIASIVAALILAFSLMNFFNFFAVLVIAFVGSMLLLLFYYTAVKKENVAFNAGCDLLSFFCCKETWWMWIFALFPLVLFLLVAVIGGMITAPLWLFIKYVEEDVRKKVYCALLIAVFAAVLGGLVFFIVNPQVVYTGLHFGAIIGIVLGFVAIVWLGVAIAKGCYLIKKSTMLAFGFSSFGTIPVMVLGIILSMNATYYVSTVQDMNIMANAAMGSETVIILQNDLDFEGQDCSWFGVREEFHGYFEGNGHTLSHIDDHVIDGFVRANYGIIRNLNFEECNFSNYRGAMGVIAYRNHGTGAISECNAINCHVGYGGEEYSVRIVYDNKGKVENCNVIN
jgi:hypothetical protein